MKHQNDVHSKLATDRVLEPIQTLILLNLLFCRNNSISMFFVMKIYPMIFFLKGFICSAHLFVVAPISVHEAP